jgi:hypothetical protein
VPVNYQHGPQEHHWLLDNGQHILIGAYSQTLALMQRVGTPSTELLRTPLTLMYPDGQGLRCPDLSRLATNSIAFNSILSLLEAMMGIASLPWRVSERWALMTRAMRWRQQKFSCVPELSVADLCAGLPTRVLQEFIEPLCVSALNTPTATASAQVFLRVLQDALLGPVDAHAKSWGLPSHLLIPRTDLGHLFPERAAQALAQAGVTLRSGERAQLTCATAGAHHKGQQPMLRGVQLPAVKHKLGRVLGAAVQGQHGRFQACLGRIGIDRGDGLVAQGLGGMPPSHEMTCYVFRSILRGAVKQFDGI